MRGLLVNFFLLALCLCLCTGHYRRISIDNTDICDETVFNVHKPVSIGTGAIILELSRPSIAFHPSQHKSKLCEIHIKAPEGFGITAYVEEAFLRQNVSDKSCKDYVQFGQDDSIVFVTLIKSDRICGHIDGRKDATKGFTYDDPHGNLLVWVNMWGRKKTTHWPAIYKMNLTLVLTAYQSNCGVKKTSTSLLKNVQPPGPGFASCGSDPGQCISKNYFCDKRFNCINHDGVPKSHDEADCQYAKDVEEENRKKSGDDDDDDDDDDEVLVDPGALNTISWVLIGICSMLGFLLVLILAVGCTKNSFCGRRHDQDCNSVDEPINLVELSANRPIAEQNIYLPLEPIPAGQISNQTTLPEEPPPAYHSLFPTDYVHPDQSSTNE